jgi:galactokinase
MPGGFNIESKLLAVKEETGVLPFLVVSAPGRADFLNTHQDYKGLPVVPIAVNLRTYIFAVRELGDEFRIVSLNLKRQGLEHADVFNTRNVGLKRGRWFGNYLRSVFIALQQITGEKFDKGLEIVIDSEISVASGLASSGALEVAFAKLLNEFYGLNLSRMGLAEASFVAENQILGIPCGRLDQYASAFGGAILLYPRPPVRVEHLPLDDIDLVVVDSGVRHSVADIHPRRQEEINKGLSRLMKMSEVPRQIKEKFGYRYDEPEWNKITIEEITPYLKLIDKVSANRILYTIKANASTIKAIELIRAGWGEEKLGELGKVMSEQHEMMRDLYDLSLRELEEMRNVMLKAGALGVKISGAGLGGCLIGLVRNSAEGDKVLEAALRAGAVNGWTLKIDGGVKVEYKK